MDLYALLRELYETQRALPNRNYAKGHSFAEWVEYRRDVAQGRAPQRRNQCRLMSET